MSAVNAKTRRMIAVLEELQEGDSRSAVFFAQLLKVSSVAAIHKLLATEEDLKPYIIAGKVSRPYKGPTPIWYANLDDDEKVNVPQESPDEERERLNPGADEVTIFGINTHANHVQEYANNAFNHRGNFSQRAWDEKRRNDEYISRQANRLVMADERTKAMELEAKAERQKADDAKDKMILLLEKQNDHLAAAILRLPISSEQVTGTAMTEGATPFTRPRKAG